MDSDRRTADMGATRRASRPRTTAALCTVLALLAGPPAVAGAGSPEIRAGRLARALPADAEQLEGLREPARTAQAQVGVALDQLEQMEALVYDPHYLPALVAVGRAFVAVSGRDPFTGTVINPDYSGLDEELAANVSRLQRSAAEAGELRREIRRLSRRLALAKRRPRRR